MTEKESEIEEIELIQQNWLDEHNGKNPHICKAWGYKIDDFDFSDLDEKFDDADAMKVVIDDISVVVIQFTKDKENQYGRHVGSERWWRKLDEIPRKSDAKKRAMKILKENT